MAWAAAAGAPAHAQTDLTEVERRGAGPDTLLLIPGFSCRWNAWQEFAVTLPGFGGTPVPDLPHNADGTPWRDHRLAGMSARLDREGLRNVTVTDHSFGTMLAVQRAARRPDAISGVAVDGSIESATWTPAVREERRAQALRATTEAGPCLEDLDRWHPFNGTGGLPADSQVSRTRAVQAVRTVGNFAATLLAVTLQHWRENPLIDLTAELQRVGVPILDIRALRGKDQTEQRRRHLADLVVPGVPRRVRTVFLYDTGHHVKFDAPVAQDSLVAAFIGGSMPGESPWPQSYSPERVAVVEGLAVPESARYDEQLDLYFVSNVNGHPARRTNDGFISRVGPDGDVLWRTFIAGGQAGVTLHAPKGMALAGDTLWVTDIDVVRGFDRHTGAPLDTIALAAHGALFLNDIALGPDGSLYVSDTGLDFPPQGRPARPGADRVFRIDPSRRVSVLVEGAMLAGPNGLFHDVEHGRLLIAPLFGRDLLAWHPDSGLDVAATGAGGYDGIERLPDGRIIVSSQDAPGILELHDGELRVLIPDVSETGDIGVDSRRHRIAIPRLDRDVLEIWALRPGAAARAGGGAPDA